MSLDRADLETKAPSAANHTAGHTELVHAIRLRLGREPDLALFLNSRVSVMNGQRRAAPGLGKGSSDLVGIGPQGRFFALEVKTGKGVPTEEQRMFRDMVRAKGGFAAVVRSEEEAVAALERARSGENA
jgi:hypothetical protein